MRISKDLQARINKAVSEKIDIVPYDPEWVKRFEEEKEFLMKKFPQIIKRIEHFGSTAIPGLAAKPVIDMLVEVTSFRDAKRVIVPALEALDYEYFWRPEFDKPPYYVWFIKRDKNGKRTHHIHMVRKDSKLWERIYFRDYLRENIKAREEYGNLKTRLSKEFPNDRVDYTKAKTDFILSITRKAKEFYKHKARGIVYNKPRKES